jgi:hypothetical protein
LIKVVAVQWNGNRKGNNGEKSIEGFAFEAEVFCHEHKEPFIYLPMFTCSQLFSTLELIIKQDNRKLYRRYEHIT